MHLRVTHTDRVASFLSSEGPLDLMSGLRDFVTGSDVCSAGDGAGPSNAVNALVNQLLGGASKTQEQLRDVSEG